MVITTDTQSSDTDIFYIEGTTTITRCHNGYDISIFGGSTISYSLYTQTAKNSVGRKLGIQTLPNSDYEEMASLMGVKATLVYEIIFSAVAITLPVGIKVFLENREAAVFKELGESTATYKVCLTEGLVMLEDFTCILRKQF